MNVWRYQTCERVEIDAPIERVYAAASDPELVPLYAREIARIEIVERLSGHLVLVKSHLRLARLLTLVHLYRFHYRPPTHYSGVAQGSRVLRGYFSLTFQTAPGGRTTVSHTEGILSVIPLLAWVAGVIYFRVLGRDEMTGELDRLKRLVEDEAP